MTKIAIDYVTRKLTSKKSSHNNGWVYLRALQLSKDLGEKVEVLHNNQSWDDYDIVYLYHGMAFGKYLNLFDGANEESGKTFERLITCKCELRSLDIPMPDYGKMCRVRLILCDDYWRNIDWHLMSTICKNITNVYYNNKSDILTMGDSHSFSVWKPESMIIRKDSRTLRGVLRKTLRKEIEEFNISTELTKLTLYYGNIDVRHHLMREADPKNEIELLLIEYVKQIKSLNIKNIELVCLLPIEDESRKLPKTGQFDETNFKGSQSERSDLVHFFNNKLKDICEVEDWDLYKWPQEWYNMSPLLYQNKFMENRQNVHISPEYHRTDYWESENISLLNF